MKARVLYSGGKDSSLAAVLLEPFFDVELVTCTFGREASWENARDAAKAIGFPFRLMKLDENILDECCRLMLERGWPRPGIDHVHRMALEAVASLDDAEYVSDGTRRDDKSPMLNFSEVRSLEDRHDVAYVRPLAGYGKRAIDALVKKHFEIVEADTSEVPKADYETEIRSFMKGRYGDEAYERIFPPLHTQSRVIRRYRI